MFYAKPYKTVRSMEPDKKQVLVEPSANNRLAEHIEFLARVSEQAAVRLYSTYEKALLFLENHAESCPPYAPDTPIDAQLRYKLFDSRYRIVFEIIGNAVYVYDIQDCRQNSDKNIL